MQREKEDQIMEAEKIIKKMNDYLKESLEFSQNHKATEWGEGVEFGLKCALDHLEFLLRLYND